ncbi:hypothetical protein [Acinetobacter pittii]|uniref:hypothetical protein n=1 Tax=Acinetobacter pittii TaxID=48296 RepID=UPI00202AA74E|nr:hypothetical protein [Acinetobacter pittii]
MEIAARLAKVTALIISRDVVIDYALYGTPELALVANNKEKKKSMLQFSSLDRFLTRNTITYIT